MSEQDFAALSDELDRCMIRDRFSLRRELHARRKRAAVAKKIRASVARAERRAAAMPSLEFPESLPVSARRDELAALIEKHQVVIVAGETGSGKTTQLPKICLSLGRGILGRIGHTQPRRVAARTVAARIAEETGTDLGAQIGYQVRFNDKSGDDTLVKVMTDGILLAETQNDRFLEAYDTLIIDEAHERSLNIDFLLGYLRRILPKRPDLKVIVTSATIDLERFSRHFGNAPVLEVSGRTYPVDLWYRPLDTDSKSADSIEAVYQGVLDALDEIRRHQQGDVLVFLSGEREIRDMAQLIRRAGLPGAEVLPLYSRLSNADQNRVFAAHKGWRIVLATNVAETSLTVPGIRYVIDPGLARVSRYSARSRVQQLPIEKISQASAEQRKGRCGRVADGICIRLYSEDDFAARAAFTQPEILRTNLAAVILQMLQLKLGDIGRFPFIERPEQRQINDGFQVLHELGAVDRSRSLTRLGRDLARYPIDLRLARMMLEGARNGCLKEVLIIVSAMTIQDPRERPHDHREAADNAHRQFADEKSDFLAWINLWEAFEVQRQALTRGQLRRYCRENFLSEPRLREWRELHRQLLLVCRDNGLKVNRNAADYDAIHRAILAGLLSHIGQRDGDSEYSGAHGRKHHIFPGSSQFRRRPRWIVSGELVETTRLYARSVAQIDNNWLEPLAGHLVKRQHEEPFYCDKRRQVMVFEQVSLYGLVLVNQREVDYAAINPAEAREIFIQEALVMRRLRSNLGFYKHNNRLIREMENLESRTRKRDILVESHVIYDFYDQRLPADVVSAFELETFAARGASRDRSLHMNREMLSREQVEVSKALYPDSLEVADVKLPLSYRFEPEDARDGVSLKVPLAMLRQVEPARLDWIVPGLLEEKCLALIKSLPKRMRKHFIPAPDFAARAVTDLDYDGRPLTDALAERLFRLSGTRVSGDDFQLQQLDNHLRINIQVTDDRGKVVGSARSLEALREDFADVETELSQTGHDIERSGITAWDFAELPERVALPMGAVTIKGYPALVDEGDSVAIRVHDNAAAAKRSNRAGLVRLYMLSLPEQLRYVAKNIPGFTQAALFHATQGSREALLERTVWTIFDYTFVDSLDDEGWPRSEEQFTASLAQKVALVAIANEVGEVLHRSLELAHAIRVQLSDVANDRNATSIADIRKQLQHLVGEGIPRDVPRAWLQHFPRFMSAIKYRVDKLATNVSRDQQQMVAVQAFEQRLDELDESHDRNRLQYRWLLEEFRVSQFAQTLGTSVPVSAKRLEKCWAQEVGSPQRN